MCKLRNLNMHVINSMPNGHVAQRITTSSTTANSSPAVLMMSTTNNECDGVEVAKKVKSAGTHHTTLLGDGQR